jgi:hypothetical protein
MTRYIDDSVERLAGKRREPVRFVAVHTDEASAIRNHSGHATRGTCHVIAPRRGVSGNRAPEKLRAAEDQQTHSCNSPGDCARSNVISPQQFDCEPIGA